MSKLLTQLVDELNHGTIKVVDLTQPLGVDTPVIGLPPIFGASPGFSTHVISKYDEKGPAWYWSVITLGEHTGTHFDAPIHWITGKDLPENALDTIPASKLIGPACVIDCSKETAANPDFLLTVDFVKHWETTHGMIPSGAWLLLRTDWSHRTNPVDFLNVLADGAHSPGFHADCSRFLARERNVLGVGVETVGTDAGQAGGFTPPFPNHTLMHGAGKFGLASLRNLDQLPATGSIVIASPLKIAAGSGSPCRVLALVG